jgi:glycerol-3-phosphate dehydrogenase (NAD(P)+)
MVKKHSDFDEIGIIGAGSFGTAMALQVAKAVGKTTIFARKKSICDDINFNQHNSRYLGEIILPSSIRATQNLKELSEFKVIIVAVPSGALREVLQQCGDCIRSNQTLILATAGIEKNTAKLPLEVAEELFPENNLGYLAGANFASELARGFPSACEIGSKNHKLALQLSENLTNRSLKVKPTTDIISMQITGCIKSIAAIMCGIALAREYGDNARAMLQTLAIRECMALSIKLGGDIQNFTLFSVFGDLVMNCNSLSSGNMRFGHDLAISDDPHNLVYSPAELCQGAIIAEEFRQLARNNGMKLPICEAVANIVSLESSIDEELGKIFDFLSS